MQIGQTRNHGPDRPGHACRRSHASLDLLQDTGRIPLQQHIVRPAIGQQGMGGKQGGGTHAGFLISHQGDWVMRPWRTTVGCGRWPNQ